MLFATGTAIQDFVFSSLFSLWPQALLAVHYSNPALKTTSFCFLMGFSIAFMTIVSKCLIKINSSIFATDPGGKLVFSSFSKCWTGSINTAIQPLLQLVGRLKAGCLLQPTLLPQAAPTWPVSLHLASVWELHAPWPGLQAYRIESGLEGSLGAFGSIDIETGLTECLQDPW